MRWPVWNRDGRVRTGEARGAECRGTFGPFFCLSIARSANGTICDGYAEKQRASGSSLIAMAPTPGGGAEQGGSGFPRRVSTKVNAQRRIATLPVNGG